MNFLKRWLTTSSDTGMKEKKIFLSFFFFFFFLYPRLNQSLKWRFDYIIVANDKFRGKRKIWTNFRWVLWKVETKLQREFSCYIVKIPQVKGSFNVLINKRRGKILEDNLKQLFDDIKYISKGFIDNFLISVTVFVTNFFFILNL